MDERAAFERNIDDNPLDATNHLVYADWLDENGHPDEAAFRRSMGEWTRTPHGQHAQGTDEYGEPVWSAIHHRLPVGVSAHDLQEHAAGITVTDNQTDFPSYRAMEAGMRHGFMANRPARQSRRVYSRRTGRNYR